MMLVRSIKIRAEVFPNSRRESPFELEELANIDKFIKAVEDAAKQYLPSSRSLIKIKEHRETETRLGY